MVNYEFSISTWARVHSSRGVFFSISKESPTGSSNDVFMTFSHENGRSLAFLHEANGGINISHISAGGVISEDISWELYSVTLNYRGSFYCVEFHVNSIVQSPVCQSDSREIFLDLYGHRHTIGADLVYDAGKSDFLSPGVMFTGFMYELKIYTGP
jgi:hypothetical protein